MAFSMDYRRRAIAYKQEGHTFKQLREAFGIPSETYYQWKEKCDSGYYAIPIMAFFSGSPPPARLNPHGCGWWALYFFGDIIASQAPGAQLDGYRGAVNLGLHLLEVGLKDAAGPVFRVAHPVSRNGMFSANIAGP
jgi:hypothetical protein